jgi:hypothetical protein
MKVIALTRGELADTPEQGMKFPHRQAMSRGVVELPEVSRGHSTVLVIRVWEGLNVRRS